MGDRGAGDGMEKALIEAHKASLFKSFMQSLAHFAKTMHANAAQPQASFDS
jgi:hypothetical protein